MVEKIYLLINTKNMSYMTWELYKDLSRDLRNKYNGIIKSEFIISNYIKTILKEMFRQYSNGDKCKDVDCLIIKLTVNANKSIRYKMLDWLNDIDKFINNYYNGNACAYYLVKNKSKLRFHKIVPDGNVFNNNEKMSCRLSINMQIL
ncbi:hypothetical protein FACS189485_19720 [Spirochaetia bacterium]|nr:hypothetical protein FACS189485_19720 [Spirochaetia bacterium]